MRYTDYDMDTSGLTDEQKALYHAHLPIREITPNRFGVASKSKQGKEHSVLHDGVEPLECQCETAVFNRGLCAPQAQRVRLVLLRHNQRIEREDKERQRQAESDAASAKRTNAPLGSKAFSLT